MDHKKAEQTFESDKYAHYLHCAGGCIGTGICQICQIVYFKYIQFNVQQSYLEKIFLILRGKTPCMWTHMCL